MVDATDSSPDHIDHIDQPTTKVSSFDIDKLPASFKQFLKENDIDPEIYTVATLPRYVRLNTHLPTEKRPTVHDLRQQLDTEEVYPVKGLENFFRIQLSSKRISDTQAYKDHTIFGIDLSSAIAVEALDIKPDDQILDLCCAPGAKLCMVANVLGREGLGTATGVDLAGHRLATCRSLLKKYKVGEKVRLFEADGTRFQVPPPSRLGNRVIQTNQDSKRAKPETVKPFWASRLLRFDRQIKADLYDKVLVDAECTHDGSILHILKVSYYDKQLYLTTLV
ncbi:S-adenosyl-L-methionine-dependent methyltransferase [Gilbertella persicaria]|uniref:S-adenosyl-L-methionine-dependent methyltransferase n=1 Tax=Gilbertella persicaria TaxID=101096 RepID=UPI002220B5B0|nr:S-adenosyl-L-methionine-dependent methyltransferase [Gilbertella persicaria]KAI8082564.1 S-adenosyl-L-methionine-dependent methyltransferase [Gilbertella persicaria]